MVMVPPVLVAAVDSEAVSAGALEEGADMAEVSADGVYIPRDREGMDLPMGRPTAIPIP